MTRLEPSQRLAVCSVLAAMALAVLDAGIVNVALPIFSREFQASASDTVLVVTFYQAALLIGLMPAAH